MLIQASAGCGDSIAASAVWNSNLGTEMRLALTDRSAAHPRLRDPGLRHAPPAPYTSPGHASGGASALSPAALAGAVAKRIGRSCSYEYVYPLPSLGISSLDFTWAVVKVVWEGSRGSSNPSRTADEAATRTV
jgi:hypothetical protein